MNKNLMYTLHYITTQDKAMPFKQANIKHFTIKPNSIFIKNVFMCVLIISPLSFEKYYKKEIKKDTGQFTTL